MCPLSPGNLSIILIRDPSPRPQPPVCPSLPSSLSMYTFMRHLTSLHDRDLAFRSTFCTTRMRLSAHSCQWVSSCVIALHAALAVPSWLFSQFCVSFSLFLASCFCSRVSRNICLIRRCSLTSLSIRGCDEHATIWVVVRPSDVPRLPPFPSPSLPPLALLSSVPCSFAASSGPLDAFRFG